MGQKRACQPRRRSTRSCPSSGHGLQDSRPPCGSQEKRLQAARLKRALRDLFACLSELASFSDNRSGDAQRGACVSLQRQGSSPAWAETRAAGLGRPRTCAGGDRARSPATLRQRARRPHTYRPRPNIHTTRGHKAAHRATRAENRCNINDRDCCRLRHIRYFTPGAATQLNAKIHRRTNGVASKWPLVV